MGNIFFYVVALAFFVAISWFARILVSKKKTDNVRNKGEDK